MKFEIYQLPNNHPRIFRPYESLNSDPRLSDYRPVYEGNTEDYSDWDFMNGILEDLFYVFNESKPLDYKGRSLSVSDVIVIGDNAFYVDCVGFRRLFDFFRI